MLTRLPLLALILLIAVSSATCQELPETPPVLLQIVRDDAVHNELDLSTEQIDQLRAILRPIDADWFRVRNLAALEQRAQLTSLTDRLRKELPSALQPQQMDRLEQLARQALGTRMVVRDDVATALKLSPEIRQRLLDSFVATDKQSRELHKKLAENKIQPDAAQIESNRLQAAERKQFSDRLSNDQKSKLAALTGKSFDFTKITRRYPLAPELADDGVTWVQGGPLQMDDLRGKVVAVHFYAFQCINCQRNLPHYKAWYQDYADKGLVVIGIQTPETAAERQIGQVKTAANREGIKYPVVLDSKSKNWQAWSNTMWPTVYLIDKQGFLRRWWRGEMNWKGTDGEQQMRTTIEQLLAE